MKLGFLGFMRGERGGVMGGTWGEMGYYTEGNVGKDGVGCL